MSRQIPELDRKGLRNFAWMFTAMVAGLFGLILPWLLNLDWPLAPWAVAIMFFIWGLVAPNTLRLFYRLWMRLAFVMNAIMTRVFLGAVFFIALLPYGVVFRLLGKDPMHRNWEHQLSSYRVKSPEIRAKDMEKPY